MPGTLKDMPTVKFVQKDFINAFFRPIPDLEIYNDETWQDSSSDNYSNTMSYEDEARDDSSSDDSDTTSPGRSISEDNQFSITSRELDTTVKTHSDVSPSIHTQEALSAQEAAMLTSLFRSQTR